jgi:hypothetical protein
MMMAYKVGLLIEAAQSGDLGSLERLLGDGVDPNGTGPTGETALLVAARRSRAHAGTIRNLLFAGANPNAVEPAEGRTALHLAIMQGNAETTRDLLEHGADLGIKDKSGHTPLELARQSDEPRVVEVIETYIERHSSSKLRYLSPNIRKGVVMAVAVSRDGKTAAAGVSGEKESIVLWDTEQQNILSSWEAHGKLIETVCFSPDGRSLLSGGGVVSDYEVHLWSVPKGGLTRTLACFGSCGGGHLSFSEDGAMALCTRDWSYLWEPGTGRIIHKFPKPWSLPCASCLSPDGATMLEGKTIWDCVSFKVIGELPEAPSEACFIGPGTVVTASRPDWSPNEKGIDLKMWRINDGQLVRKFQGHSEEVIAICASGDGRFILSESGDGEWRLWNSQTAECIAIHREAGCLSSVGLSHDGSTAVLGYKSWLIVWRPLPV